MAQVVLTPEAAAALEAEVRKRRRIGNLKGVVVMPDLDPLPVPPADDIADAGERALLEARGNTLGHLLEQWKLGQQ